MKRFIVTLFICISFFSCKKDDEKAPSVTTMPVSLVASVSAFSGFVVESKKFNTCAAITARGICWNTSPGPTAGGAGTTLFNGCSVGQGQIQMNFLTPNTTYYVRAYATYSLDGNSGTVYGEERTFTTLK
jgi:hypothetical protein